MLLHPPPVLYSEYGHFEATLRVMTGHTSGVRDGMRQKRLGTVAVRRKSVDEREWDGGG